MMTLTSSTGFVLIASLLMGLGQTPAPQRTLATAGAIRVTVDELLEVVGEARKSDDLMRLADSLSLEGLETLATAILERKLLAEEARARSLDQEPRMSRMLTGAAESILADEVAARERAAVDTSDAALRRFYDEHADRFRTAPRRKARHIVVTTREEAAAAQEALRAGHAFTAVAAERNIDGTNGTGGSLGWVPRKLMVQEFEDVVFALPVGRVSEPVKTMIGWHIVMVEELDPGMLASFELLRDRVAETAREDAVQRLKGRLRQNNPMTIDRAALAVILR